MKFTDGSRLRVMALAKSAGMEPSAMASRLYGPAFDAVMRKTAIDVMGSTGTGAELLGPRMSPAFVLALRQAAVITRLGAIAAPMLTQIPFMTAGTDFDFIGERMPIACAAPEFGTDLYFARHKIAGIVVMTNELLASSQAESILETDMRAGMAAAADRALLDPSRDDAGGTRPAAITHGIDATVDGSTADDAAGVADVVQMLAELLVALGSNLINAKIILSVALAVRIAALRAGGLQAFPTVTATGGTIGGLPLLVSGNSPVGQMTIVDSSELLLADPGEIEVATSQFAMIDQSSVPAGNTRINMFQEESTAIKGVWYLNWSMKRPFVAYADNLFVGSP